MSTEPHQPRRPDDTIHTHDTVNQPVPQPEQAKPSLLQRMRGSTYAKVLALLGGLAGVGGGATALHMYVNQRLEQVRKDNDAEQERRMQEIRNIEQHTRDIEEETRKMNEETDQQLQGKPLTFQRLTEGDVFRALAERHGLPEPQARSQILILLNNQPDDLTGRTLTDFQKDVLRLYATIDPKDAALLRKTWNVQ